MFYLKFQKVTFSIQLVNVGESYNDGPPSHQPASLDKWQKMTVPEELLYLTEWRNQGLLLSLQMPNCSLSTQLAAKEGQLESREKQGVNWGSQCGWHPTGHDFHRPGSLICGMRVPTFTLPLGVTIKGCVEWNILWDTNYLTKNGNRSEMVNKIYSNLITDSSSKKAFLFLGKGEGFKQKASVLMGSSKHENLQEDSREGWPLRVRAFRFTSTLHRSDKCLEHCIPSYSSL